MAIQARVMARAQQVSAELDGASSQFAEGDRGELCLWLDRALTLPELQHIAGAVNGKAFRLLSLRFNERENKLVLDFEVAFLFLGMIPLVIAGLGAFIGYWTLRKKLPALAIPVALGVTGALAMGAGAMFGTRGLPITIAGVGLTVGGVFLGWRTLFPPPEPETEYSSLTAEYSGGH